ncbi:MAG: alkaline phosphatase family protein [Deltaproteobacteria bacterium]|nr:alkaline phosphatase family protein [Deltaproteobacteria bacterium]
MPSHISSSSPFTPSVDQDFSREREESQSLRWPLHPSFYLPHSVRSVAGVFPTVYGLLGRQVPPALAPHLSPPLFSFLPQGSPRSAGRVLFLLLDSLGFKELAQAPVLSRLYQRHGTWITSVFPTVTSTATTSLYQGLSPARHGMAGHVVWMEPPGLLVDTLRMIPAMELEKNAQPLDPRPWRGAPGLAGLPAGQGAPGMLLLNRSILGSGLSGVNHPRERLAGYGEPLEGASLGANLLAGLPGGWVGWYLPTIDYLSHGFGGVSPEVTQALHQIEENLTWLARRLAPEVLADTTLVVASDHGQSLIQRRVNLKGPALDALTPLTRGIGFSGRVLHVYLRDGLGKPQLQQAAQALEQLAGEHGRVVGFAQARPWLGEGGEEHSLSEEALRRRLGDWLVVLEEGIHWDKTGTPMETHRHSTPLVSQHGGLAWDEMVVPLIVAPLSEVL